MKYTASITIVDDGGESVFERELTQDEIIEELLKRPMTEPIAAGVPEHHGMVVAGMPVTISIRPPAKPKKPRGGGDLKEEEGKGKRKCGKCGQPGHIARHCPENPAAVAPAEETSAGKEAEVFNMTPIGKKIFQDLKQRQDEGVSAEDFAEEFEHDLEDVRVAVEAKDYFSYLFRRKDMIARRIKEQRQGA